MKSIIYNELRINQKPLLIWSIIMFLLAAFGGLEFSSLQGSFDVLLDAVETMPKIVRAFFGIYDELPLNTPIGQYACMQFWYALIAYAYAAYFGAYILARDEHRRTSEFLYTKPFKRSSIMAAKLSVAFIHIFALSALAAIGTIAFLLPGVGAMELVPQVLLTTVGMLWTQCIFVAIGMLCTALLNSYRKVIFGSFAIFAASFAISMYAELFGDFGFLNALSPIRYFRTPAVVLNGLSARFILLSLALIIALLIVAAAINKARDLRAG
ncbi:MAG: ABC transporter permease [Oscillospiraceae bacterium]|nr:ABC transporter permease [Oscillospiraceae bacterium]